jgi:hypothetical protein
MFEHSVKLAIHKAATEQEHLALRSVCAVAVALDEQERTFEARINESKARRGEPPTQLSKAKRQEVDQYARDAEELTKEQLRQFEALDAWAIVFSLHMALETDARFWSKAHLKAHPSDASIIQDFAQAKADLRDALASFLEQFPHNEG